MFCPAASLAVSPDPLVAAGGSSSSSGSFPANVYLAVGLDSNLTSNDAKRRQLNLVILLDVSGSMGESFNASYIDLSTGMNVSLTAAGGARMAPPLPPPLLLLLLLHAVADNGSSCALLHVAKRHPVARVPMSGTYWPFSCGRAHHTCCY